MNIRQNRLQGQKYIIKEKEADTIKVKGRQNS